MRRAVLALCALGLGAAAPSAMLAATASSASGQFAAADAPVDPRLRTVRYSADEVYRLCAYVGYEIDLQFAPGERFVGLGAGDVDGLSFAAEANHLFIKPRAADVRTNLTVLTNARIYHFDYVSEREPPDPNEANVIYALRFTYPAAVPGPRSALHAPTLQKAPAALLAGATDMPHRNADYWYCGRPELRPLAAWDDGVQTHLRFGVHAELPALFVLHDDGSEALVDFHVEGDELVAHRVARRFVLRLGRLVGCVVNRSYAGSGAELRSGTLSPQVERTLRREAQP